MSPKVSVVMPVYNAERTIRKSIESLLMQTFDDFEFIIVDDGSKDSSWALIQEFAGSDDRIIPIRHEKNQGNTAARNTGLRAARGEFIAVQDADDLSLPERLALEVDYLDSHPEAGAVAGPANRIDGDDRVFDFWPVPKTPDAVRAMLLFTNPLPHTTVMVRRALVEQIGGYRTQNSTDYDFLWQISRIAEIHTLHQPLAHYRSDITDQNRITVGQASKQVQGAQEISLGAVKAVMDGKPFDEDAYRRFFMSIRGMDSLKSGDTQRLQPLWDTLAADRAYRETLGPRLLSCAMKNTFAAPSEALKLLRVVQEQFNIPTSRIARKYARYLLLNPLARRRQAQSNE